MSTNLIGERMTGPYVSSSRVPGKRGLTVQDSCRVSAVAHAIPKRLELWGTGYVSCAHAILDRHTASPSKAIIDKAAKIIEVNCATEDTFDSVQLAKALEAEDCIDIFSRNEDPLGPPNREDETFIQVSLRLGPKWLLLHTPDINGHPLRSFSDLSCTDFELMHPDLLKTIPLKELTMPKDKLENIMRIILSRRNDINDDQFEWLLQYFANTRI